LDFGSSLGCFQDECFLAVFERGSLAFPAVRRSATSPERKGSVGWFVPSARRSVPFSETEEFRGDLRIGWHRVTLTHYPIGGKPEEADNGNGYLQIQNVPQPYNALGLSNVMRLLL
jgi:hypothetical protein